MDDMDYLVGETVVSVQHLEKYHQIIFKMLSGEEFCLLDDSGKGKDTIDSIQGNLQSLVGQEIHTSQKKIVQKPRRSIFTINDVLITCHERKQK